MMEKSGAHEIKLADKIAEEAHQLFFRYGIRAVTMDDIAHNLSISKKTVYKFFADKNALVEDLIDKEIQSNKADYTALKERGYDGILELFLVLAGVKNLYAKINSSIIRELTKNYTNSFKKLIEHLKGFTFQAIKTSIKKGIDECLFQDDLNIDLRCDFFLESLSIISATKIVCFNKYKDQEWALEILENLIAGIASVNGIRLIKRYKNKYKSQILLTELDFQLSTLT